MASPTIGWQEKIGAGVTGSAVTKQYEWQSGDMKRRDAHLQSDGPRGTRDPLSDNVVKVTEDCEGTLVFRPDSVELDFLLPYILGTAESADVFALADLLTTVGALRISRDRVRKRYHYDGVYVDRAVFRSREGGPLEMELTLVGTSETEDSNAFPTLTISIIKPYIHSEGVWKMGNVTYSGAVRESVITINNFLSRDFRANSLTLSHIVPLDREITLGLRMKSSSDEDALYDVAIAGLTTNTVKYTKSNRSLQFTFGALQKPTESEEFQGRRTVALMPLNFVARSISGGLPSLSVTNDSTEV
jgi:hypothetical protein